MVKLEGFTSYQDGDDWSPAMSRALQLSRSRRDEVIEIPVGKLRFSGPIAMNTGTVLMGSGGCPANLGQGTVLMADFDGDFITWDGRESYRGGGGGLERIVIAKAPGRSGGNAILLTGSGPSNRCGWFDMNRVLVYAGADAGNFDVGVRIDGTKISVSGSAGVRDVTFRALMLAGCNRAAMEITNGVHVHGSLQTAIATGRSGDVVIDGGSQDVQLQGRIYGTLVLREVREITLLGRASAVTKTMQSMDVVTVGRG